MLLKLIQLELTNLTLSYLLRFWAPVLKTIEGMFIIGYWLWPIGRYVELQGKVLFKKSVGNNINDLMKEDPLLANEIIAEWEKEDLSKETMWIIKQGRRSLRKNKIDHLKIVRD